MTKLIDELKSKIRYTDYDEPVVDWDDLVTVVETLQSAQFATDINVGDTISRKMAIDALTRESLRLHALHWGDYPEAPDIQSGVLSSIDIIRELPSSQPEPCVDTIDALNESIKHFDDMAEECRRNANIERNDYMDMRDDAAEYRQLSTWLNELRWLRERFQSQPERKKGRWINKPHIYGVAYCSECDFELHINDTPYCPNCGRRMEGDDDETMVQ